MDKELEKAIQEHCDDLGIDLSKWELEGVEESNYCGQDFDCREIVYRNMTTGYILLFLAQHFNFAEWVVINSALEQD